MPALEKELMVRELTDVLDGKNYLFFSQFSKLNVSDFSEVRRKVEKVAERSLVLKNRIAKRVFADRGIKDVAEFLNGATLLTVANRDPQIISKILLEFTKEKEGFETRGAYIDGQKCNAEYLKTLADLPSREVLIATVVGGISAPLRGFVNVLSQVTRSLVTVLDQIQKQKASS